jgi:hypothetical protein
MMVVVVDRFVLELESAPPMSCPEAFKVAVVVDRFELEFESAPPISVPVAVMIVVSVVLPVSAWAGMTKLMAKIAENAIEHIVMYFIFIIFLLGLLGGID